MQISPLQGTKSFDQTINLNTILKILDRKLRMSDVSYFSKALTLGAIAVSGNFLSNTSTRAQSHMFGGIVGTCDVANRITTVETCTYEISQKKRLVEVLKHVIQGNKDSRLTIHYHQRLLQTEKDLSDDYSALHILKNRASVQKNKKSSDDLLDYRWPSTTLADTPPVDLFSTTWSGVMAAGNPLANSSQEFENIFAIEGTIRVPQVSIPNSATACQNSSTVYEGGQWIGLGGAAADDDTLYQAGVEEIYLCATSQPLYVAFWEDTTEGVAHFVTGHSVYANDSIVIHVSYPSPANETPTATMHYIIHDQTQGWTVDDTLNDPAKIYPTQSAEAIVERVCDPTYSQYFSCSAGGLQPLPFPSGAVFPFSGLEYSFNVSQETNSYGGIKLNNSIPHTNNQPQCWSNTPYPPGSDNYAVDCIDPFNYSSAEGDTCETMTGVPVGGEGGDSDYSFMSTPTIIDPKSGLPTLCN